MNSQKAVDSRRCLSLLAKARAAIVVGGLATSGLMFSTLRYIKPETGGLVVNSGPHVAAAIVLGVASNLAVESTNRKNRYPLKHALTGMIIVGLGCLAINHGFELYGHPIDRVLDGGANPALSLRQQGELYGDWAVDDIATAIAGAASYLATAATFKFGNAKNRLKSRFGFLQQQRSSQP